MAAVRRTGELRQRFLVGAGDRIVTPCLLRDLLRACL